MKGITELEKALEKFAELTEEQQKQQFRRILPDELTSSNTNSVKCYKKDKIAICET